MAQIKEPYGLVYNTDGSLCTTYRDDVVPFRGVRSFAVETATTNFLGPYAWEFDSEQALFYPYWLASGKTWADCWDEKQKAYVGGHDLTCYSIRTRTIDLGSVQAAGTKITLSWKHKGYLWLLKLTYSLDNVTYTSWAQTDTVEIKGDASLDFWESGYGLHLKINGVKTSFKGSPQSLLDRWYDIEITYTLPTNARYVTVVWDFYSAYQANGGLGVLGYIHKPQLEVKPFASSFVNGTRPSGRFEISVEDLGFNPATDDWVVHYWKYPVATQTDDLTGYNLCSIGRWTSDKSEGYIYWGKTGSNVFEINVVYNDSTYAEVSSPSFDPAWYFRNWHHEVLLKHGSEMQYWIDGILQVQASLTKPSKSNFTLGLSVGGHRGIPDNAYIANLYYGFYTEQWTDEYIREVYEAQIPFAVSNKLSIY